LSQRIFTFHPPAEYHLEVVLANPKEIVMLRAATTIRALLLLGGFGAAIAAAQPAAAQSQCISGYYYNPFYGCMVAGEALRPLPRIITPPNDFAHPHYPSSGFDPHNHMAGGGYVPQQSLSPQHLYVPPSSSGFSMSHAGSPSGGSFGHGSFGGGGFGGGGFGGGGFGGGGFGGGGHGR
jgi:uncharacterized membrane protein YgcG